MSKVKDHFFTEKEEENFYELFGESENEKRTDRPTIHGNEQSASSNDGSQEGLRESVF